MESACQLLDVMRENGLEPGQTTYSALLSGTNKYMYIQWLGYCYSVHNFVTVKQAMSSQSY